MNYKPGTVGVATVRGVPNVRVFLDESEHICWTSAVKVKGSVCHYPDDVTDMRPLVVLDLAAPDAAVLKTLRIVANGLGAYQSQVLTALADQIEAATKPPRIPEPGLWGVVEATVDGKRLRLFHGDPNENGNDWHNHDGWHRVWADLIDPVLVRPGIEDES